MILIQTLQFLTRLPSRQDGVENRDMVYFIIPLVSGGEEDIGDFPLDCLGCCCLDFPCDASDGMLLSDETAGSFAEGSLSSGVCSAEDRDGFFVSETDEQAPGFSSGFDAGELGLAAGISSSLANW